ncbi:hypothetical protein JCM13664_11440 [Methylothermus subterraneus]
MTARAYLSHLASGRTRLKIPSKRGDVAYFQALQTALAARSDVLEVEVNPRTGSILLVHDVSLDLRDLGQQARQQGWFDLDPTPPSRESLSALASRQLARVDAWMRAFSGSRFDNPSLIFLALVVLAVRQLAKGHIAPPAATTLWYLYQLLQRQE